MADLWELICHHTYMGVPGCVVDLSPSGASHGEAIGLAASDFLKDGAAPGSGAIDFGNAQGRVRVRTTATPWERLEGVKGEVTLKYAFGTQYIIDSDGFELQLLFDQTSASFGLVARFRRASGQYDAITTLDFPSGGQWVTLGFMNDGFGRMELSANGHTLVQSNSSFETKLRPGSSGITIGNRRQADEHFDGQIDEVKVWRLNPRRFDDGFNSRPTDGATSDCWTRRRRAMSDALARHPECARQIGHAMDALMRVIMTAAAQKPDAQATLAAVVRKYSALWSAGNVSGPEMKQVFADLIGWLKSIGISVGTDAAIAALTQSECLHMITGEMPPLDCDPQVKELLATIADLLR